MKTTIFISNISIKQMPINLQNRYQLELTLFDTNNKEYSFATSLMKEDEVNKYKKDLFKMINANSNLQAIHSPQIKEYHLILDENNKIAGLEFEKELILKNEIKMI